MSDIRHLFLDTDSLRRWDSGMTMRFPKPEKVPITGLEPGPAGSWDARVTTIYGSVLVEDGKFRMWYVVMPDANDYEANADYMLTAYAESDDGIHWVKPDLKLTSQQRFPGNNIVPLPGAVMGVVRAQPGADFKYLAVSIQITSLEKDVDASGLSYNGPGTYLFASDDGFRWRQLTEKPLIQHGDVAALIADPGQNRYLLYQKAGMMHGLDMRRAFFRVESRDGVHWEGYQGAGRWHESLLADDYDDLLAQQAGFRIMDHYGLAMYPIRDNFYVAVENLFFMGSPLKFAFGQNPNGIASTRIGFSHDALHWRRPKGRPSWLEVGQPGDFDAGFIVTASTFVEHGDHLLLYYGGSRYDHGWCINSDFAFRTDISLSAQRNTGEIGLARIERDRFASLSATYDTRFEVDAETRAGDALYANVRCPHGSLRVAICDINTSQPLPGFSFDDCLPITADSVRAPIRFKKARVRDIPADQWLMLHFELKTGEIFGYAWGDE